MKNAFGISSLCMLLSAPAFADVNVISWGGSYGNALVESQVKPFQEKSGIRTTMTDSDNPAPLVKAMVEAGNVTSNVIDLESADAIRFCEEGLLERIDASSLPPGIDGTPAEEDFIPGALSDCGVGIISYGTIIAFDTTKFENSPQAAADFFDLEQFPGKRALRKSAKGNLELALIADGVPASEVYDILETDEGVDRAFAKLDTIKHDVVWWEAGQQAAQLLADGEVVMTTSPSAGFLRRSWMTASPSPSSGMARSTISTSMSSPKGHPTLRKRWHLSVSQLEANPWLRLQAMWRSARRANPVRRLSGCLTMEKSIWLTTCRPIRTT